MLFCSKHQYSIFYINPPNRNSTRWDANEASGYKPPAWSGGVIYQLENNTMWGSRYSGDGLLSRRTGLMGDSWFSKDKFKHFSVTYIISTAGGTHGAAFAMGGGLCKEWCDSKDKGNHWCWKDIVWDLAGTILGSLTHYLIFKSWLTWG